MTLTEFDKHSDLWARLLVHFEERRAHLRAKNDGPHDATVTAVLRGQIQAYSALIALDKSSTAPPS